MLMVVVNRFTIYMIFIQVHELCSTHNVMDLFYKNMVKYLRLQIDIVNYYNAQFIRHLQISSFKQMGLSLTFSTAHHPQIDGQTKYINTLLEEYYDTRLPQLIKSRYLYQIAHSSTIIQAIYHQRQSTRVGVRLSTINLEQYGAVYRQCGKFLNAYQFALEKQQIL